VCLNGALDYAKTNRANILMEIVNLLKADKGL